MKALLTALLALLQYAAVAAITSRFGLPPTRDEAYTVMGHDLGDPLFSFAMFADTQYGTMKPSGMRYYKLSVAKMKEMTEYLKANEHVDFIMHLGDLTQDKGSAYRRTLLDTLDPVTPLYNVLGNHDFKGVKSIEEVLQGFSMQSRRYVVPEKKLRQAGYKFIVVDATEISTFGNERGSPRYNEAVELSGRLKRNRELHWETHNGAVGKEQLAWLDKEVAEACAQNLTAVMFTHSPLLTGARNNDMHTWDRDDLLKLVSRHRCAKVWVSGHVHVHRHVTYNVDRAHHVHLWTTSGMVQTPNTSFVVVDVHRDYLFLRGVSWGTSFCKFLNLTGALGDHSYDYNFSSHHLTRTHYSSRAGGFKAPLSEIFENGATPPPVAAFTFKPDGRAYPEQLEGRTRLGVHSRPVVTPVPAASAAGGAAGSSAAQGAGAAAGVSKTQSRAVPRAAGHGSVAPLKPQTMPVAYTGDADGGAGGAFVQLLGVAVMMVPVLVVLLLLHRKRHRTRGK